MLEQYNEALWFFCGVFVYRFLSTAFTYGHLSNMVKEINDQILKMLGTISADTAFARSIKYKHLTDSGIPEEQIEIIKKLDDKAFTGWKTICIAHMFTNCPKIYRNTMKFSDWEGAMEQLEIVYARELARSKRFQPKREKK